MVCTGQRHSLIILVFFGVFTNTGIEFTSVPSRPDFLDRVKSREKIQVWGCNWANIGLVSCGGTLHPGNIVSFSHPPKFCRRIWNCEPRVTRRLISRPDFSVSRIKSCLNKRRCVCVLSWWRHHGCLVVKVHTGYGTRWRYIIEIILVSCTACYQVTIYCPTLREVNCSLISKFDPYLEPVVLPCCTVLAAFGAG